MGSPRAKDRAVRGDRADGQGVRQPASGSSCSTCSRRRRAPSTSSRAPSGQSTANASQHLQALHAAGMVSRAREGTRVRYALAGDEALRAVARPARRVGGPAGRGRARRARLPRRRRRGDRPRGAARAARAAATSCSSTSGPSDEYDAGHIEGAARSRSTSSSGGWPSCPPTPRSWPTAAGRSAPTPMRRSGDCAPGAGRTPTARTAGPNGGSPDDARSSHDGRPVDVDACARRSARLTPTSRATSGATSSSPPGAGGRRSSAIRSRSWPRAGRRGRELRRRRQSLGARPDRAGRRACSISAAWPGPTC